MRFYDIYRYRYLSNEINTALEWTPPSNKRGTKIVFEIIKRRCVQSNKYGTCNTKLMFLYLRYNWFNTHQCGYNYIQWCCSDCMRRWWFVSKFFMLREMTACAAYGNASNTSSEKDTEMGVMIYEDRDLWTKHTQSRYFWGKVDSIHCINYYIYTLWVHMYCFEAFSVFTSFRHTFVRPNQVYLLSLQQLLLVYSWMWFLLVYVSLRTLYSHVHVCRESNKTCGVECH